MNETTARKLASHLLGSYKTKQDTNDTWDRGHYWGVVRGAVIITGTNPDDVNIEVERVANMLHSEALDVLTVQLLMAYEMNEEA